jgi:hypothetical protein
MPTPPEQQTANIRTMQRRLSIDDDGDFGARTLAAFIALADSVPDNQRDTLPDGPPTMRTEQVKGTYVAPRRTVVSPEELRAALRKSLTARGIDASEHALTALVAMSAFETGEWRSCWNFNLGNVKASPSWEGSYTCLTNVWEVLKGVTRWFSPRGETDGKSGPLKGDEWAVPPGHPQTRFRAFATLEEGLAGFVEKMTGRYRPSFDVLLGGGSTDAFIAQLKRQSYFTGDLSKYQSGVRKLYAKFSGQYLQP